MLEKMGEFFDSRLDGYEDHQLTAIQWAREFYPFTAGCLPMEPEARVLELGCGTGLELDYYFRLNPSAGIIGVDLAPRMLQALKEKFGGKQLELICGSYFDVPFPQGLDGAVSVESLHHFTQAEKAPLYAKVRQALRPGASFILTDYFALSEEEENGFRQEFLRLKAEQSIGDKAFYHFDTPLTVEHEIQALQKGGFSTVEVLNRWGQTATLRAINS